MGWSQKRCPARSAEAAARTVALEAIHYRGRVNPDGEPLNGRGIAPRMFSAGLGHEDEVLDREAIRDLAVDRAEVHGGFVCGDPETAFPQGYRWPQRGENA